MKRKLYEIVVHEDGETGMDFNSFVENPAHGMDFIQFNSGLKKFHFNDEKRIILGVAIATDVIIPRYDEKTKEEFDVTFRAPVVEIIKNKFFKNNFHKNSNLEHNSRRLADGVHIVESYQVSNSNPNFPKAPECFKHLKLADGSWILGYYIENDDIWNDAKKGKFNGFSIEVLSELKIINQNQSKMKKKSFWSRKQKFSTAKTIDSTVYFDGDLTEGTTLFTDEEMTTPVTDASLIVEIDGEFKTIELDGSGVVQAVATAESFDKEVAVAVETVEGELVAEIEAVLEGIPDTATMEEVAQEVLDVVLDVIAEADEAQFASIKKFAKHKILDALKLAREAKVEPKPAPKRKFPKNKTNGKPAVEAKKATFADLRKAINSKN